MTNRNSRDFENVPLLVPSCIVGFGVAAGSFYLRHYHFALTSLFVGLKAGFVAFLNWEAKREARSVPISEAREFIIRLREEELITDEEAAKVLAKLADAP